jgi:hypothetical protein
VERHNRQTCHPCQTPDNVEGWPCTFVAQVPNDLWDEPPSLLGGMPPFTLHIIICEIILLSALVQYLGPGTSTWIVCLILLARKRILRAFTPENEQALRQAARRFAPWRPRLHQPPGPIPETRTDPLERATVHEYVHTENPAVEGQTANILPAVPAVVLPGAPAAQAVVQGPVDPFLPIGHNTRNAREFAIVHNIDPTLDSVKNCGQDSYEPYNST